MDLIITEKQYDIIDGPGRDMLFDVCKYLIGGVDIPATFRIVVGYTMPLDHPGRVHVTEETTDTKIVDVIHDGAGGLDLQGYCKVAGVAYNFHSYYNTHNRKGKITFSR